MIFGTVAASQVQWKQVVWGLAIQFVFGLMVLRWDLGRNVVDVLGRKITSFLKYTDAGSGFVYGYLVSDDNKSRVALGFIFAFKVFDRYNSTQVKRLTYWHLLIRFCRWLSSSASQSASFITMVSCSGWFRRLVGFSKSLWALQQQNQPMLLPTSS